MSKYTTELRFICENAAGLTESGNYSDIDSILDKARDKIFDFPYPIFDENYRATLENKVLKHYYTREIGAETVGLWKLWLNTKMNEIMPYYNQLYKSALIEFNPMYDVDLTTNSQKIDNGNRDKTGSFSEENSYRDNGGFTQSKNNSENGSFNESLASTENKASEGEEHSTTNGTSESSTSGTDTISTTNTEAHKNDHWDYYSDTPQGGISGLANNTYLTNARHVTDDTTGSTSGTTGTNTTSSSTEGETSSSTDATSENTTTTTVATAKNGSDTKSATEQIAGNNNGSGSGEKSGTNESNEVIRNTEDYLHHVVGKTGGVSYSKMLKEYRDTFLNIDMMIIKDLRPLFMNLW